MEDRLAALGEARFWAMSPSEVVAAFDSAYGLMVEAQALLLRLTRQVDSLGVARSEGASSTAVWMRNRHRMSIHTAYRLATVAKAVDAAPEVLGEAVASGAMNLDQADVITRALVDVPAEVRADAAAFLVKNSAELDPAQLRTVGRHVVQVVSPEIADEAEREALEDSEAKALRKRCFTMTPDDAGVRLYGRLTHEGAAVVRAAIEPLLTPVPGVTCTAEQRRADALVEVCRSGEGAQVVLVVDYDVVRRELGAATLDTGEQLTPQATRVAFPGCDRAPRWTQGHHVLNWAHGGPTCLSNGVLLCWYHHTEIHKGYWRVYISADGLPSFIPPASVDPEQKPRRITYHRRP